jgi:hypothetical protein
MTGRPEYWSPRSDRPRSAANRSARCIPGDTGTRVLTYICVVANIVSEGSIASLTKEECPTSSHHPHCTREYCSRGGHCNTPMVKYVHVHVYEYQGTVAGYRSRVRTRNTYVHGVPWYVRSYTYGTRVTLVGPPPMVAIGTSGKNPPSTMVPVRTSVRTYVRTRVHVVLPLYQ